MSENPVLVIDEDGDFRIDSSGERGEKNILLSGWLDDYSYPNSGYEFPLRFELVPVEETP